MEEVEMKIRGLMMDPDGEYADRHPQRCRERPHAAHLGWCL